MGVKVTGGERRLRGGGGTGMLQRNSQSASFKDIIEETVREDVERVWLGGGGEG